MGVHFRLTPEGSRFTVQAFAGGLLSFLGHNPTFVIRDFRGAVWSDTGMIDDARLEVVVRTDSLKAVGDLAPRDREEIERRLREEVLQTDRYPEVTFQGTEVSASRITRFLNINRYAPETFFTPGRGFRIWSAGRSVAG